MSKKPSKTSTCGGHASASTASSYDNDLAYLQAELQWIETRCKRISTQSRLNRQASGEKGSRPRWELDKDVPAARLERLLATLTSSERRMRTTIDARLEAHRSGSAPPLSLESLCETYQLDDFERVLLLLAAAPCFSRSFEDLYDKLDSEQLSASLTVEVAYAFLEVPFTDRIERRSTFAPRGKLVSNDLLSVEMGTRYHSPKDLLLADIEISSRTFSFMIGQNDISEEFLEFSSVQNPMARLDQVVLADPEKQRILSVVERHDQYLTCRKEWGFDDVIQYGRGVLMLFHGKPGTGKTMTAHGVAATMGKRILNVDIPTFAEHREADRFLPSLFREARLQDAVLFFDECEVLFASRMTGNTLMTLLLSELERFEGVAILATNIPQVLDEALDRRILVKVRFPEPDRQARLEIWRKHLPSTAPLSNDIDLDKLADRYELTGGYIKNAVLTAVAEAVHGNGETPSITMAHLDAAARAQIQRPREEDDDLARPVVRLEDVVLEPSTRTQVVELLAASRNRRTVLDRWGIGAHLTYGKGVSALLFGGPGTGKTLCAEAVAGELGRPLLTAAVPALVSKWVGETEKNLEYLFKRARSQDAVLFLDEADSLLMERGEGRASRHDDSAVNVLLKLIERHTGVVLLATNLHECLDRALGRRLTYQIHFSFPGAAARTAIWRRLLPATVPLREELDLIRLGRRFGISGGRIKNAVFKAAFRAANADTCVTQRLLEEAATEELRAAGGVGEQRVLGFA